MITRTEPTVSLAAAAICGLACAGHGSMAGPLPITSADGHRVEASHGVVVSVSGPASQVGVAILRRGGNAVDAAIATAFALVASYPPAGNIGGGGFMLVHPAKGRGSPTSFDYRETAPAAATATMFSPGESQYTHKAVATPGSVRGLALAHHRFGTLPWADLVRPAVAIARDGFALDSALAESMNATLAAATEHREFQRVFGKTGGGRWQKGDRLVQPDLARTLDLLATLGPDAFYSGPIAAGILAEMGRGGGLITAADLSGYRAIERAPLAATLRGGISVFVPPPPSSGGICLIEELHMLQVIDLPKAGRFTPQTFHLLAEIMRRANYDRARYLGDPAFTVIPTHLTSPAYAHRLASHINFSQATRSEELAGDVPISRAGEGESTTHFSVIDNLGMAVANTYTLERRWGSRIVVQGMGFLLNNDMFAFNLQPGVTDRKGAIGTPPNTIAPGKRPLTSQTPTIAAQDGSVKLVTGSPGSRSIPHTVLQILLNVFEFAMPLEAATQAPRMSHQWFPDELAFEAPESYPDLTRDLKTLGHRVVKTGPTPQGDAHSILVIGPHRYLGVADRRINGSAAGY